MSDLTEVKPGMLTKKHDSGKPRFSLIDDDFWCAVESHPRAPFVATLPIMVAGRRWVAIAQMACSMMHRRIEAMRLELARLLTHGANVYDAHNWRKGMEWSRILDAMLRHMDKYERGEVTDHDSGCHHLSCVVFGCMVLHCYERDSVGVNDLFVGV